MSRFFIVRSNGVSAARTLNCSSLSYRDLELESFELEGDRDWIQDAVLRGATMVNPYYEPLLDDYSLMKANHDPKLALGDASKKILAKIFVWVLTGWGQVLDRIANESGVDIPAFALHYATLLATVQVPAKKLVAKIESAEQRKLAEKILDEYLRTGKVVRNIGVEQQTDSQASPRDATHVTA